MCNDRAMERLGRDRAQSKISPYRPLERCAMNSRNLSDATVAIGIAVLIMLCAEGALRILYPYMVDRSAYQLNADYLYTVKPGISKEFVREDSNGGNVIVWRTNKDSFRGEELDSSAARPTIIVYGDSNIQARFSESENTFAKKLQSYLQRDHGLSTQVLNAGVVGFGPDQSVIRMSGELARYHPDIVVIHLFADNDFGDLVRNQLFEISSGRLTRRKSREDIASAIISQERSFRERVAGLLIVRMSRELLGINTRAPTERWDDEKIDKARYRDRILAASQAEYFSYLTEGPPSVEDHYDIDIAVNPDSESSQKKIALMRAILREARQVTRANGVELMVVIQPSVVDLTQNLDYLDYSYLDGFPQYRRDRLSSILEEICLLEGISYVNLFSAFLENNPEELFFHSQDNHWNEAGQDLAARRTASHIKEKLLPQ
jgi:SGNH hydrolase-like domain, acetyltransferase AlgX